MNLLTQDTRPDSDYRTIPLSRGNVTVVDAADYEWMNQWKWFAIKPRNIWYAVRTVRGGTVYMHRAILGITDPKIKCDHHDGDGLNNRRRNLRPANNSQNLSNRGLQRNNKSGYAGIYWRDDVEKWQAQIKVRGRNIYLGCFQSLGDAIIKREKAADKYQGEFAHGTHEKRQWVSKRGRP